MDRTQLFLQRPGGAFYRRKRRVLVDRTSVYHVISRMVRQRFWLGEAEREMFCRMLRKQAAFAGIEVLAHCVMSNHFHLLLRVPEKPLQADGNHLLGDAEILRRYAAFYGEEIPRSTFSVAELKAAFAEGGPVAEHARRIVLARMGDLSAFMKELKQRFGIWFNDRHNNLGTIWSDRFKSILVENTVQVLSKVAAYIDLNPVRAEMVDDPGKYRWSGFGEAMRGAPAARLGLCALFGADPEDFDEIIRTYRRLVYHRGDRGIARSGNSVGRIDPEAVQRVMDSGGKVSVAEALHCRMRDFTETVALGGDSFLGECQKLARRHGSHRPQAWSGWQRFSAKIDEDE